MTDQEKRHKAADIGDEALDFEAGPAREAFIGKKCEGDSRLVQYVLQYLAGFKQVLATKDQPPRNRPVERKNPTARALGETPRSTPPQQVLNNRYKLIRLLGRGGMGKVFEALDLETGQPVAIKAIRSDHVRSEDERMRFVREARAASRLNHPNIVAIHDINQNQGALYIVMEYLRGTPLTNFVAVHAHVSLATKLSIMVQVADALGYAHAQGIIHRDVKPQNIILLRDQSARVLDFGIAEQADLPNTLVEGSGTVPYMSPEQLGKQTLDAGSDIWSTGITLFQFLTGNLPYRTVQEILSAPPPEVPKEFPLSREINIVLARALAKDRQMRYANADELAADLRTLLQVSEIANPPVNAARFVEQRASSENYVLPDLNFSIPVKGELTTTSRISKWWERKKSLWESRNDFWRAMDRLFSRVTRPVMSISREIKPAGMYSLFGPILIPFLLLLVVANLSVLFVLCIVALTGWLVLTVPMRICAILEPLERLPTCRGCGFRMRRTARFIGPCDNEETIFACSDLHGALSHGLWQDAAKLLSIHASRRASEHSTSRIFTPFRYSLNFFECELCSHHAARLTTDMSIAGHWEQQPTFGETYWGSVAIRPSMPSRLATAPRACFRPLIELLHSLIEIRFSVPKLIAGGVIAVIIALISSATLNYREHNRIAAVNTAFQKRFKTQVPAPGSEAAVRRTIEEFRTGTPNYDLITPYLADTIRRSLPQMQTDFASLGALRSVRFKRVSEDGADIYQLNFENGALDYMIWLGQDGMTRGLGFLPNH